jgi:hypothetical protein
MGSYWLLLPMPMSKADASRNDMDVAAKLSIRFPAVTALNSWAVLHKNIFAGSCTGFCKNYGLASNLFMC